MAGDNPLLVPSDLPFGLPRLDQILETHYLPAFSRGMAEQLQQVEAIVGNADAPSFENTLVALERSGELLGRVSAIFDNAAAADATPGIQAIKAEVARRRKAHSDAIWLNAALYARVKALHERHDQLGLDAESARLLERYHTRFVREGARLSPSEQERLRLLNQRLAELTAEFSECLLADTNDLAVMVTSAAELAGLSQDAIAAAADAARAHGHDGYLVSLVLPTSQPSLASLENRALRERIHQASTSRGARGNDNDTSRLVLEIVTLRAERARLLGYANHADYVIEDNVAGAVDTVQSRLGELASTAVRNAAREAADLQDCVGESGGKFALQPWDWAFYAARRRRERYAVDAAELRPYFELERVLRDGVYFAAERLYGLSFVERTELPAYHPDARVFEVFEENGEPLGLFIGDFHTRDTKAGGAWSRSLVDRSELLGTSPIVVNNLNFSHPAAGKPTLLDLGEVRTLFHEFGHALHALLSAVRYPMFAGINVPRDFVEYPSQVNEMWAFWPEVLANYAKHHLSGEPLPPRLIERVSAARAFNQGFETSEHLAAVLLDLAWHTVDQDTEGIEDVETFEARALAQAGVALPQVPPRYRSTYFKHIFGDDLDYSAAYYSYIWSEIPAADTVTWFEANGGLTRDNGAAFRALLAKGGSTDPLLAYRDLLGREPRIEPLLSRRGLISEHS
ncbi:M3 family metallopeptidase [Actinomadura fibrosa]|uniref:M3 family metallopeptidase n=1 Tax=Actinomadura fibrosa TaxID=111802 RepID=A0ABW2Y4B7_9ACTN|nr:M3 family metallopeptidase [Actinomadura fibrosa]